MSLRRRTLLLLLTVWFPTQEALALDAALRVGFVLNFARYTRWPADRLKPEGPLTICLAPGDVGMADQRPLVERKTIQQHPVVFRNVGRPAESADCHVLYLPADQPGPVEPWLGVALQAGCLTISDQPDFVDRGGIIGLMPIGGSYRFAINLGQARQAGLGIDAHLLKLATTVK